MSTYVDIYKFKMYNMITEFYKGCVLMKKYLKSIISLIIMSLMLFTACTPTDDYEETYLDDYSNPSDAYISPSVEDSAKTSKNTYKNNSSNKCEVCGNDAPYTYDGFGGIEYYCYTHYNELNNMLDSMYNDVTNKCEVCGKDASYTFDGFGGTEYYCYTHYSKLLDMLYGLY